MALKSILAGSQLPSLSTLNELLDLAFRIARRFDLEIDELDLLAGPDADFGFDAELYSESNENGTFQEQSFRFNVDASGALTGPIQETCVRTVKSQHDFKKET